MTISGGHRAARAAVIASAVLLVMHGAYGQKAEAPKHRLPAELRNQCGVCHACPTPTKTDPCLIVCPRVKESTGRHTPADGPGLMLMSSMTRQYGPVPFNHRAHAQMAEMSGGCYGCHHYNDTALNILPCKTCHPAERKRENVNLPDLKGAYHRQCLDCHRQWSGSPDCKSCHLEKSPGKTASQILEGYARGSKDHPPVAAPSKKVYTTREQDGTVVAFHHTDHAGRFGLSCVTCHRNEGCISCHDRRPEEARKRTAASAERDFDALHARCSSCHAEEKCETCHTAKEKGPFDHGQRTGWALRPYHAGLACSACHRTAGTFTGLKNECTGCHRNFASGTFNHAVTGLKLDEVHGGIDCADCHPGKAFGKPPSCAGCHQDKAYPAFKPGKKTGP